MKKTRAAEETSTVRFFRSPSRHGRRICPYIIENFSWNMPCKSDRSSSNMSMEHSPHKMVKYILGGVLQGQPAIPKKKEVCVL
ncbi:MAG: hypothetical protein MSS85_03700 [Pyramidobacter sp.]|nr:hypothetical protein [Pyramidobacter sp.]